MKRIPAVRADFFVKIAIAVGLELVVDKFTGERLNMDHGAVIELVVEHDVVSVETNLHACGVRSPDSRGLEKLHAKKLEISVFGVEVKAGHVIPRSIPGEGDTHGRGSMVPAPGTTDAHAGEVSDLLSSTDLSAEGATVFS